MPPWKNSTSLILAIRQQVKPAKYDYNILLLKRHQDSSFMPGMYVFPGGMTEAADCDLKWINLFSKYGFDKESYYKLFPKSSNKRPLIFQKESSQVIDREITLRITAIRETFEECGILLCKKLHNKTKTDWAEHFFMPLNEIKVWQEKIQNDASEFFTLCKNLQCYPDLWSLHEWNNWLTPTTIQNKRFNAAFFFAAMNNEPVSNFGFSEIEELKWQSPDLILKSLNSQLPPPQHYEIYNISKITRIDNLLELAIAKSDVGSETQLPVMVALIDGTALILPGDSLYPQNVSLVERQFIDKSTLNFQDLRKISQVINRIEIHQSREKEIMISNFNGNLLPSEPTRKTFNITNKL